MWPTTYVVLSVWLIVCFSPSKYEVEGSMLIIPVNGVLIPKGVNPDI